MRPALVIAIFPMIGLTLFGQSSRTLVRQAHEDSKAGRYSQAEKELSQALTGESGNWSLWCDLGAVRIKLEENGAAIDAFEHAHQLAPQEASPYFGLGFTYMKAGDARRAAESYQRGLVQAPDDLSANQNYALLLLQQGDFGRAIEPLKRLKTQRPRDVSSRAALVEAYVRTGMHDEGAAEVDELLNIRITTMQQELSLAAQLLNVREVKTAARVLQHAVDTWPDAAEPHGELGLLLAEVQQYQGAVEQLGRAAQLEPDSARYGLGLGEALLRWRHDPVALKYLMAVKPKFGSIPLFKFEMALAHFYLTQFSAAQQEFLDLADQQPKSSRVQYLLGGTYQAMGEMTKAESCFRRAIALKPDDSSYYVSLATLLKKLNPADLTEPVDLAKRALGLNADNQDAKLLLASCYQAQGKLSDAQVLLEAVVAQTPEARAAHVALAKVYFRQKKVEEAQTQESIAAKLEEHEQNAISPWGPGGVTKP
jgi:Flp pilus assembly protein TadD